jgi:hypothetical protein
MNRFDEFYSAVDEIKECLIKDLFGVSFEDETLEDIEPISTYVTGILYPIKTSEKNIEQLVFSEVEEDEIVANDVNIEDQLEAQDDTVLGANKYRPRTMGLSVMLPASSKSVLVVFECGKYIHMETEEKIGEDKTKKKHTYKRSPQKIIKEFSVTSELGTETQTDNEIGIELSFTIRKIMPDGSKLVTTSLINQNELTNKLFVRNESHLFQCKLSLKSDYPLIPIYQNLIEKQDEESQIRALMYRDIKNYAYGHGCSVAYNDSVEEVFEVHSDFVPVQQVLQMMPGDISEKSVLSLKGWQTVNRNAACNNLNKFISEYSEWRENQENSAKSLTAFATAAKELLDRIDACIIRLKNGVELLSIDNTSWQAFLLMNEAMLLQRQHSKGLTDSQATLATWYPFQLAYILQIIPDIVNEKSDYRNCVDLLWFPTGGGKTEAYLGVAAFTIFYRRLQLKPINDGVTVIMRYTLRLLTIQQFERATALICACEYLRKRENIAGGEISIGLWIGSGMTPNHIAGDDGAEKILHQLKEDKDKKIYTGNPVQITACPWCGTKIDVTGYDIDKSGMTIRCKDNPKCEFYSRLPIYVVDDDIYMQRPTLLLSTIDKFARIAWVEETSNLFGVRDNPPSLIIQDELHLISGSLGSLAGIYEIAVDYLCQKDGISPKIIASTATVKNADEQIRNLYNKKFTQFPPSGISFNDSFFSHIASKEERPARTYVGLCSSGGSMADLLIRVYAVLMFTKELFAKQGKSDAVRDQYYTIIGYFNAIRDLGATATILSDRMYTHIRSLIQHKFKELSQSLEIEKTRMFYPNEELTSRKSAKEIKETLQKLEIKCSEKGCYSYVLASNMLSVGIDINRLGLMTVYNQPKTNAEYIQATSRVGRQNPGIVLSMYNCMRSRDKSHYEQFGFYHKTFYQYVEATSVTPCSERALEKALHCIFVSMVRLTTIWGGNDSAVYFKLNNIEVNRIKEYILRRVKEIKPNAEEFALKYLSDICDAWEELAKDYPNLHYFHKDKPSLLSSAEEGAELDFPTILNSLRNVEPSSNVYVQGR